MSENNPILQVKDLTVSFNAFAGKVQAVRGVSFDLNKGETLCIVGESGSGKSVTNKAIMGILSKNAVIDRGEILYDGMDLTKLTEEQFCQIRGKRIAMVFQDPLSALNPIMKVGKQITETLCVHQKLSQEQAKKRALELMAAVGIPEPEKRFNQYPFQFSGGMRQRIVIVIALACNPEILICDEPTTALDVTIQSKILDLIKEIKQERNLSVIFITHNMGVVANMADRICVMYAGKIVEFGTCDDIFYHPAHPYTWGVLQSIPPEDTSNREPLHPILGTPPDLFNPPAGCPFAARCPYAMKVCSTMYSPAYSQQGENHYASCWLYHKKAVRTVNPITEREVAKHE